MDGRDALVFFTPGRFSSTVQILLSPLSLCHVLSISVTKDVDECLPAFNSFPLRSVVANTVRVDHRVRSANCFPGRQHRPFLFGRRLERVSTLLAGAAAGSVQPDMDTLIVEPAGSDDYLDDDEPAFNDTVDANPSGAQRSFLNLNGLLPNLTRKAGDSIRLKCRVTGSLPITFRWYKNDAPLLKEKNRVTVKSRDYWSRLRIANLHVLDSGYYRCDASNKAGSVQTTSLLKIQASTTRGRVESQSALMMSPDNDYPIQWVGEPITGTCQPYRGKACSRVLSGQKVLVHSDDPEYMMDTERQLLAAISVIANTSNVSEACKSYSEQVSCYHNYQVCDQEIAHSRSTGIPILPLCKKDCLLLEEDICLEEYESAKSHGLIGAGALLPNCGKLSDHVDKCVNVVKLSDAHQVRPSDPCYVGSGKTYRGTASISESGGRCGRWSQFSRLFPHYRSVNHPELTGHNYCRNPGGQKPRPWCFTENGREEYCRLNRCPPDLYPELLERELGAGVHGDKNPSGGDRLSFWNLSSDYFQYIMVAGGVLGVLVLAVLAILFVYCFRARKARKKKGCAPVYVNGNLCGSALKNSDLNHHHQYELATLLPRSPPVNLPPEIPACSIHFVEILGDGHFGKVWKGELLGYSGDDESVQVAVVTLNEDAPSHQKKDFEQEVARLSRLRHSNIVDMLGVSTSGHSPAMVFEFMVHGDLHEFLLLRAPYSQSGVVDKERIMLDQSDFLHVATQVASGMEYLSSQHFVHRDLATRNCLVTDRLSIKIAEFGLIREDYANDYYYVQSKVLLPVRWMPPEAILYGRFSEASDVWAFGVTMWEMYTYGTQPFFGYPNQEVIEMVRQRCLLQCPENCPTRMYSLMVECWHESPSRRPQFGELHGRLQTWSVVSTPAHSSAMGSLAMGNGGAPSLTRRSSSVHSGQSSSIGPSSVTMHLDGIAIGGAGAGHVCPNAALTCSPNGAQKNGSNATSCRLLGQSNFYASSTVESSVESTS
uniref:Receptor protein-tyrosine kinase n=1 Tax=Trichuris muris TaxID=70415 RepID=A0A5S6QWG1_TRIMR